MADFGYDVADYCGIDPRFGTLADFDALLERAGAFIMMPSEEITTETGGKRTLHIPAQWRLDGQPYSG